MSIKNNVCFFGHRTINETDELNAPNTRRSGTKIAINYAVKKRKNIIML